MVNLTDLLIDWLDNLKDKITDNHGFVKPTSNLLSQKEEGETRWMVSGLLINDKAVNLNQKNYLCLQGYKMEVSKRECCLF